MWPSGGKGQDFVDRQTRQTEPQCDALQDSTHSAAGNNDAMIRAIFVIKTKIITIRFTRIRIFKLKKNE